jgi:hypothetical protein
VERPVDGRDRSGGESGSRGVVTLSSAFSTTPSKKSCRLVSMLNTSLRPSLISSWGAVTGSGPVYLPGAGSRRELMEARGLALSRWNQLIGMESQAEREEAALATRPKKRPSEPRDDLVPDRTLAERDRDWEQQTKYLHAALAELRKLAAAERKELESFTKGR